MTETPPISEGATLVPAILSACVGGVLRTWSQAGTQMWGVDRPEALIALQGRGLMARGELGAGHFRETGLLDPETGTLILPPRTTPADDDGSTEFGAEILTLGDPGSIGDAALDDFVAYLRTAVEHAMASGETVVLQRGGWEVEPVPYCLFVTEDDGTTLHLETAPVPEESEVWQLNVEEGREATFLAAPLNDETAQTAPMLMFEAFRAWDLSPWDVAISYWRDDVPA